MRAHAHGSRGGLGRQGPHAGSICEGGWVGGARGATVLRCVVVGADGGGGL
jgi:hypothetical protein